EQGAAVGRRGAIPASVHGPDLRPVRGEGKAFWQRAGRHRRPPTRGGPAGPNPGPELSEGTKIPGEPAFLVPSPSPGWTWPLRFRTLASASARRTPVMVGCILSRSWSLAFHEV